MPIARVFHYSKRAAKIVIGFFVLFAGVVMLVTPGPGWAAIAIGLVLLSTEFQWAHRLLHRIKKQGIRIRDSLRKSDR